MLACKTCFVQSCLGQIFRLSFPISVPRKTPDARINIQWQKHHRVLHSPKKNDQMNIYELLAFGQSKIPSQVKTHTIKNSKHDLPHFFSLGYWIFTLYWIFIQRLTADNIDFCYLVIDDQFNKKKSWNHENNL